jgi:hypothetical protein
VTPYENTCIFILDRGMDIAIAEETAYRNQHRVLQVRQAMMKMRVWL